MPILDIASAIKNTLLVGLLIIIAHFVMNNVIRYSPSSYNPDTPALTYERFDVSKRIDEKSHSEISVNSHDANYGKNPHDIDGNRTEDEILTYLHGGDISVGKTLTISNGMGGGVLPAPVKGGIGIDSSNSSNGGIQAFNSFGDVYSSFASIGV
jgi:hypothetical protein